MLSSEPFGFNRTSRERVVEEDLAANEDLSIRQNNDVIGRAFCAEIEAEKPVRAKSCIGASVRIKAEQSESEGQRYFSLPAHQNLTVRLNSHCARKNIGAAGIAIQEGSVIFRTKIVLRKDKGAETKQSSR